MVVERTRTLIKGEQQMALHERQESNGTFLVVKKGGICIEHKDPENETERQQLEAEGWIRDEGEVDGVPYLKFIKRFSSVDGKITDITWYTRETRIGTTRGFHIRIKDNGENYTLDLPFGKRQFDYFTKVAENIDFSKPVEVVAWPDRENPKQTAFAIKQDGKFVQWKYTRDNMGDCPPAKQSSVTGKWNFDDQREWLTERIISVVAPKAQATNAFNEVEPEYDEVEIQEIPLVNKAAAPSQLKQDLMNRDKAKSRSMTGPTDPYEDAPPPSDDFVF
jgi:hypothetical protein